MASKSSSSNSKKSKHAKKSKTLHAAAENDGETVTAAATAHMPLRACARAGRVAGSEAAEAHGVAGVKKQKAEFTFFYAAASPFSQHHMADFEVDGVQYTCAEMYMMHQKAVLFGDDEIAEQILVASKPGAMKALGRKVQNFDDGVWKEHRRNIVKKGSMAKFSQNADLKEQLLATRGTTLVEASPRDRIWGIGLGQNNPKALDKKTWRGQNLLGYILTEVRDEIEKAESEK